MENKLEERDDDFKPIYTLDELLEDEADRPMSAKEVLMGMGGVTIYKA